MVSEPITLMGQETLASPRVSVVSPAHEARIGDGRRRVRPDQGPISVAEPRPGEGPINVLVLLDRPGRGKESVATVLDRLGPQLGSVVLLVVLRAGCRWTEVAAVAGHLQAMTQGTPVGARIAFGPRDETVAVEACEGSCRLVVDLSEDPDLRRTLKMCAIPYVVGPPGIAHHAESLNKRPRLLTPPRNAWR